jgi:hypothetical protein
VEGQYVCGSYVVLFFILGSNGSNERPYLPKVFQKMELKRLNTLHLNFI